MVEYLVWDQEVAGSSPVFLAIYIDLKGSDTIERKQSNTK